MLVSSAETAFSIRPLTLQEPALAHYVSQWSQRPGDSGVLAVANATGQPVGAAWLRVFSRLDPGYGFVDEQIPELSIAILPVYRGQGVGSLMLNALFEAAEQSFTAISLSVSSDNPAKGLYQRLGFAVVKEEGSSLTMLKWLVS